MIIINTRAARNAPNMTPEQQAMVREWENFCHDPDVIERGVYIDHHNLRMVGPWHCEPRVRKFLVRNARTLEIMAASKTLEGALKLAAKACKQRQG
jgi:hypothetical protein